MKSQYRSLNGLARRVANLQHLERRDLFAGDSAIVIEYSVLTEDSRPNDQGFDRAFDLPESMHQTHEWDHFVVEVWVRAEGDQPIEMQDLTLDLGYRTDLTSAVAVDFGRSFEGDSSFMLSDATGEVQGIHGSTEGVELVAGDRVLFARVRFQAVAEQGDNVLLDPATGLVGPYSLELVTQNVAATLTDSSIGLREAPMPEMGIFPVIYDFDDDQKIGLTDFAVFTQQMGRTPDSPEDGMAWLADFDKSSKVGVSDFAYLVQNMGKRSTDEHVTFPAGYPDLWQIPDTDGGEGNEGGTTGGEGSSGNGGKDTNNGGQQPAPIFNLNMFQVGIVLPGTMDVFQMMLPAVNWMNGFQIDRLTGNASMSEDVEDEAGDVILSIVLEDDEVYETEIEVLLDGDLIDTIEEFNEYSSLITVYVTEVMASIRGMLSDALDSE
ncbi:hypothetical protein AB1L30_09555 [Bremerella sp. JC817]|uniref:hypothetical protein n=1 Tax=Bremerella sp. JC817 TaxID=3231756 RepID=UPI003458F9CB